MKTRDFNLFTRSMNSISDFKCHCATLAEMFVIPWNLQKNHNYLFPFVHVFRLRSFDLTMLLRCFCSL